MPNTTSYQMKRKVNTKQHFINPNKVVKMTTFCQAVLKINYIFKLLFINV